MGTPLKIDVGRTPRPRGSPVAQELKAHSRSRLGKLQQIRSPSTDARAGNVPILVIVEPASSQPEVTAAGSKN